MAALGRVWHERRGFALDVLPALVYMAVLFALGLAPLKSLPGPDFALIDKVWHFIAFAGLAGLTARVAVFFHFPPLRAAALGAVASGVMGALLEVLQSLTRYRSAELADLVADVLGAVVAYAILRGLAKAAGLNRISTEAA